MTDAERAELRGSAANDDASDDAKISVSSALPQHGGASSGRWQGALLTLGKAVEAVGTDFRLSPHTAFDLEADPGEAENLFSGDSEEAARLRELLEKWEKDVESGW